MTQRVNFASKLIFLFVLSLQTSMSAMDFFASILFIYTVVAVYKRRSNLRLLFNFLIPAPVWGSVVTLFLVCCIGFAFFSAPGAPVAAVLFEFKWFLFLLALTVFFYFFYDFYILRKAFLFTLILVCLYTLTAYVFEFDLFGDIDQLGTDTLRAGGFFSNPMTFAHSFQFFVLMSLASILVKFFSIFSKNQNRLRDKKFVLHALLFGVSVVTVFLTMTRGVWLGVLAAIGLGLILHFRKKAWKSILVLITICILTFIMSPSLQDRFIQTLHPSHSYDSERLVLWKTNWSIFLESPWFGIGYGENKRLLRHYYDKYGVPEMQFEGHAHNQYLHFLAGTGIFGLAAYLVLYVYFIFLGASLYLNKKVKTPERIIALGSFMGLVCFLIGGVVESNFQHAKLKYMLVMIWALLLYIRARAQESTDE